MRQQPMALHARRSLIPKPSFRRATAFRLAAGVTISFHKILQRGIVEHGVGQKPLQPRVLVLQSLQSPSLGDIHPAEAGLPVVNRGVADLVLGHRSATDIPPSCSFKIPMICSSEKRLRFMSWPLEGQNELQTGGGPS